MRDLAIRWAKYAERVKKRERTGVSGVDGENVFDVSFALLQRSPAYFDFFSVAHFALADVDFEWRIGNMFSQTLHRHHVLANFTRSERNTCKIKLPREYSSYKP